MRIRSRISTLLVMIFFAVTVHAQEMQEDEAGTVVTMDMLNIYTSSGKALDMQDFLTDLLNQSPGVIYVGEQHNDPVGHYFELQILKGLNETAGSSRQVFLAMEMFERDVQTILDEYLSGKIREKDLKDAGRPWHNYEKDYKPMVEYARENGLAVVAGNAPARYVFRVGRESQEGLTTLSHEAKTFLPPLPYGEASAAYARKFEKTMMDMGREMQLAMAKQKAAKGDSTDLKAIEAGTAEPMMHSNPNSLAAQSLRDAAMAWSIVERLMQDPNALAVNVNGSFHSEEGMGIPEHLTRYRPGTKQVTVTMVPADDISAFDAAEHGHLGDYIVLTDASVPRSYEAGQ